MLRGTAPRRHILIRGQTGDDVGLGVHSLAEASVWCMYHTVASYGRGLAWVDLLSIYCTVVLFHSSGH